MSFAQKKKAMMMSQATSAVMQIDCGEFTPETDLTTGTYTINHALGAVPDLVVLYSPDAGITSTYGGSATGVVAAMLPNASDGYAGTIYRRINEGSIVTNPNVATGSSKGITSVTSSDITLKFDTAGTPFSLPGGYKFYWLAVKFL